MNRILLKVTIPVEPVTKKNHGQIITTKQGRTIMLPSKQYIVFEKEVLKFFSNLSFKKIEQPVNIKAKFFKKTRRPSDLVNYLQAIQDALVKAEILEDDNTKIVFSTDGSRVYYDKENPRIELEIKESNDYKETLITTNVF